MSDASERDVKSLIAVALGKLINREFRVDNWLHRLMSELEEELRKVSNECRVALYSASFSVDRGRVDRVYSADSVKAL
jgi:hypothetical protein